MKSDHAVAVVFSAEDTILSAVKLQEEQFNGDICMPLRAFYVASLAQTLGLVAEDIDVVEQHLIGLEEAVGH